MSASLLSWAILSVLWAAVLVSWARGHQDVAESNTRYPRIGKDGCGISRSFLFPWAPQFRQQGLRGTVCPAQYKVPLEEVGTAINFSEEGKDVG